MRMPRCPHCEEEFETEELTRHEVEGIVHVHCPECEHCFGRYNERTH